MDFVKGAISDFAKYNQRQTEEMLRKKSHDRTLSEAERAQYREKYEELHRNRIEQEREAHQAELIAKLAESDEGQDN